MVLLLPLSEARPTLEPRALSELARVGVTNVAVLRDDRTVGIVLEGWAFDPKRSAEAVLAAVAGRTLRARALHSVAEMAVTGAEG